MSFDAVAGASGASVGLVAITSDLRVQRNSSIELYVLTSFPGEVTSILLSVCRLIVYSVSLILIPVSPVHFGIDSSRIRASASVVFLPFHSSCSTGAFTVAVLTVGVSTDF